MHGLGISLAAASAVLFAVGAVAQQEAADTSPGGKLNLRRLLTRPAWLAGQVATVAAVVLQVVALGLAAVSVVQPLLAGGLIVALAIRSVRDRRFPSLSDLLGAALSAGGLAVFLVAARPADVSKDTIPGTVAVLVAALLAIALIAGTIWLKQGAPGALAAGIAAGIAMGIAAVLISAALTTFGHSGVAAALRSPALWAALLVALAAEYACQQAYSKGALAWSLPALTVADPLAAVPVALILLGERLEPGHAAVWAPAAIGAAVGVVLLARSREQRRSPASQPSPEREKAGIHRSS
jgi:drug/metabolite transporter (DMT)-like permease